MVKHGRFEKLLAVGPLSLGREGRGTVIFICPPTIG